MAKEAVPGGIDWIEAGTPLIKSEGMEAIRELKRIFPNKKIIADMKTMDTGDFETEMASKAGADIISILGASDDSTIKEAIKAARKYNSEIMIDLINVKNKVDRAAEVEKMGAKYVCIHVGIDQQMKGENPLQDIKDVKEAVNITIATAGGLNSENIPGVISAGADIVIVGGAITKASNLLDATKIIRKSIDLVKPIESLEFKKYKKEELIEALKKVSSSNVSDAMHRGGAMKGIHTVVPGLKMAGRALTIKTMNGDWAKVVEAIDLAEEGEVLVVDTNSGDIAIWGELATWSAVMRKLGGVVIDGAVRDVDDLKEIRFPIFARYEVPDAGDPKGFGEIGCEVVCGGLKVNRGDYIIGDDSGVVVIPQEEAQEIINRSIDVKEKENRIREEIKRGSTLSKVQKLKKWEKVVG
ncbi:MAG: Bifunctional enzyme Fae/Hps [Candidatus Methanofastidiosum methylothiophilum]|uniref:3-hexulose-6-phosphate synthase n=1 Tax=Candidatus Methanofastidiosum methylothiophilum TaxID=1705564 RepID=A0A150JI19_9EURY|nr:MAG: Bifunctional enzyme Fae/Hps [Candidatus Methanofastidiosum methylthiophilus]KYC56882.1 MAG: Bifunctional enzyme Fae/Hps [Candidatus Methanofastidiosum methylthiophilus]KYC58616.1 MAG: Bifunctional enzyme Fae/Hps [Candidatus Methanofastidiosum methylthiophilus]OQC52198.1 MAG: Bifunctional enzyme Fae/Hps [Euryarchaeota archaeon ADurb.Bin023]